jgi:hypothetical protein
VMLQKSSTERILLWISDNQQLVGCSYIA